tara:strand:- start:763 stop:966 length:204 start_codon:yes stop_codon:yes gene_type:complete
MRAHEWKTLEGIAELSTRLVSALERIADHLDGGVTEDVVAVVEPVKKIKKSKKPKDNAVIPVTVSES